MRLFIFTSILFVSLNVHAESVMVIPGEVVLKMEFEKPDEVTKATVGFRKETKHKVENGQLHVIPPVIAFAGTERDSKWAKSSMSRIHFPGMPKEYVCQVRWQYNKPSNPKALAKGKLYIDLGHRCIRTTFGRNGTTLLLENHLVDKNAESTSKVLAKDPSLKLVHEKWYDIIVEVKGDEVVIQINDNVLYGKDPLIAKNQASSFNLDAGGAGFLLDRIQVNKVGDYRADWKTNRKKLASKNVPEK
jgi:hypothetical protein